MAFTFEKLIVYQKAISYADCICAITENFPRGYGFLSDQRNRVSVSIGTNIITATARGINSLPRDPFSLLPFHATPIEYNTFRTLVV